MKHLVNISIDDVSPHPESSIDILDKCYKLISKFRDIKFTLFVPIAYWRTIGDTATKAPLYVDDDDAFCDVIRGLPDNNFELGYHGYLHGVPGISNNNEFYNIGYINADRKFKKMISRSGGLPFKPIFRPAAWRMSEDAIRAAKDNGIKIFALSNEKKHSESYGNAVLNSVVYYNVNPPFKPLKLFDKTEIVYHACEWDKNYLSKQFVRKLMAFLDSNLHSIKFAFMNDMV